MPRRAKQAEPVTEEELEAARTVLRRETPARGRALAKLARPTVETRAALMARFPAERIAETLARLMEAKVRVVRGRGENAREIEMDDHRAQVEALKLMLAYRDGRPVERQEVVSVNLDAEAAPGIAERLRASPALRAQLRRMLAEAEGGGIEE